MKTNQSTDSEENEISTEELDEFLKARSYGERLKILLIHSNKNNIRIKRSTTMAKEARTQAEIEKEMTELNDQFSEFLHTKGIAAKFKLAFSNMGESAKKQHEENKRQIEEIKNSEENRQFAEFLHTKGLKAKCRLVIENIKKSASESRQKTISNIAKVRAETEANIAAAGRRTSVSKASDEWTAEELSREFNAFLKSRGLDDEYTVVVENN